MKVWDVGLVYASVVVREHVAISITLGEVACVCAVHVPAHIRRIAPDQPVCRVAVAVEAVGGVAQNVWAATVGHVESLRFIQPVVRDISHRRGAGVINEILDHLPIFISVLPHLELADVRTRKNAWSVTVLA